MKSAVLQDIYSLVDRNPLPPILGSHLPNGLLKYWWTAFVINQLIVLGLHVHLELVLAKEGKILIEENIHRKANAPDICSLAGIAIATSKLMLRPSKAGSPCGEVRDIVILDVSDSGEVDYFDFVSHVWSLFAQDVVYLYVPVCNFSVVQVFHSLADLQEYDACDVC